MDSVADAIHQIKTEEAAASMIAGAGGRPGSGIGDLKNEIALTLAPSLLLFVGAGAALGLVIYFFVSFSDCQEDLINPYTLSDKVNSKLNWELAAHSAAVGALLLEELIDGDRLHWIALLLATPGLALRIIWWRTKKLEIDPTNVFNTRFSGRLKTRWGLMCFWHAVTLLFSFVQLVLHLVLGLHNNMPGTMQAIGEHHARRAQMMHGHPMNAMMFGN